MRAYDVVQRCCRHRWTMRYILVVVTLGLVLQIVQIKGLL